MHKFCSDAYSFKFDCRAPGWKMFGLERSLGTRLVTYADDLVILCRRGKAEAALQRLREIMEQLAIYPRDLDHLANHGREGLVPKILPIQERVVDVCDQYAFAHRVRLSQQAATQPFTCRIIDRSLRQLTSPRQWMVASDPLNRAIESLLLHRYIFSGRIAIFSTSAGGWVPVPAGRFVLACPFIKGFLRQLSRRITPPISISNFIGNPCGPAAALQIDYAIRPVGQAVLDAEDGRMHVIAWRGNRKGTSLSR
jgi:hypothetical protein